MTIYWLVYLLCYSTVYLTNGTYLHALSIPAIGKNKTLWQRKGVLVLHGDYQIYKAAFAAYAHSQAKCEKDKVIKESLV